MRYHQRGRSLRGAGLAIAALSLGCLVGLPVYAKGGQEYVDRAKAYIGKGNYKAAEIELRNAERATPQDAGVRALLAHVYLRLGNFALAERQARAARDLSGAESDYLLPLAEAMLKQGKFTEVGLQIKPGDRPPALESRVRMALATAAGGLHDRAKVEALLREAVALDASAPGPKLALARLLLTTALDEAERIIDELLAANPRAVEALAAKGDAVALRGNVDGAMQRYAEALTIDPNSISARLSRANINLSLNDFAAVDKDLNPVLKQSPDNLPANYLRAWELFKKRDFAATDKILDKISPMFPYLPEALYVQAATKYNLGQYGQAEEAVAKFVARVPRSVQGARLAAMVALRRNAPDVAIDYLNKYLAQAKPDPTTLTLLGRAYLAAKKPALGLEEYRKAASLDPENLSLKTVVAVSEIELGGGRKGLDELEKVFATDAGVTVAGPTLVLTELRAGRPDHAAEVAEKLVKRDGESELYQILFGFARIAQKRYPDAEVIFKKLVAKKPDNVDARTNLSQVYMLSGRPDDAKKVYQDFLVRKPQDMSALLGLADIAIAGKQLDEAVEYTTKARVAAPSDPAPGLKLLKLYAQRQDWQRATTLARELTIQFPSNTDILDTQGLVLMSSGDRDGAIDAYRRAYEIAPGLTSIRTRYLSLLTAASRFPEVRSVLQARLDKDPDNREVKAQLIRVEAEIGGLDAGLSRARGFARNDPTNSLYDIISADLYERAGKHAEAVALLQKAIAARPSDDAATVALSRAYNRAGDLAKAETVLTDRLKSQPDSVALQSALADFYIRTKKYDAAIAAQIKVLAVRPDDPVALNNLAWLYQQVGNLPKAREFAERAVKVAPSSGATKDTLGWVLLAQGDTEKALAELEAANLAMPGNADIQYHVAVALQRAGRRADARAILEKLLDSGAAFSSRAEAQTLLDELKRG